MLNEEILKKKLDREKEARLLLEGEIEKTTRELFQSNEFLENIIDSLQNGILILNSNRELVKANKTFYQMMNIEYGDDLPPVESFIWEDCESKPEHELENGVDYELYLKNIDGQFIPVYLSQSTITNNKNENYILSFKDLSEIKKIENDFASFARFNPAPILRLNHQGKIIQMNPSAEKKLSESHPEKSFLDLFKKTDSQEILNLSKNGGSLSETILLGNEYYVMSFKGIPELNYIHVYGFNITQRIKSETEKQELQDELVKQAYSQGVAENAIQVLHNIGNVLTSIMGKITTKNESEILNRNTQLLSQMASKLESPEFRQEMDENKLKQLGALMKELSSYFQSHQSIFFEANNYIAKECKHIGDIITTQQQYANLKTQIKSKFSLEGIIQDCVVMHEHRIQKRNINLIFDINDAEVFVEKIGLSQTISNAIVNAVEAMDEDYALFQKDYYYIVIYTKRNEDSVELFIEDNGIGIEEEVLNNLFKYGYSTKERGSGFGLHNCANYMKNNGGKIEILSGGRGQGAITKLTLPMAKE